MSIVKVIKKYFYLIFTCHLYLGHYPDKENTSCKHMICILSDDKFLKWLIVHIERMKHEPANNQLTNDTKNWITLLMQVSTADVIIQII